MCYIFLKSESELRLSARRDAQAGGECCEEEKGEGKISETEALGPGEGEGESEGGVFGDGDGAVEGVDRSFFGQRDGDGLGRGARRAMVLDEAAGDAA